VPFKHLTQSPDSLSKIIWLHSLLITLNSDQLIARFPEPANCAENDNSLNRFVNPFGELTSEWQFLTPQTRRLRVNKRRTSWEEKVRRKISPMHNNSAIAPWAAILRQLLQL